MTDATARTVSRTARGFGTRRRTSQFISGTFTTARKTAIRNGRMSAAAARRPAMTMTIQAAATRNRRPASRR